MRLTLPLFGGKRFHRNEQGFYVPMGVEIPDWREYKVEQVPELKEVERRLAARGLKNNWLRNEVWYMRDSLHGTNLRRLVRVWGQGLPLGLAAAVVLIAIESVIFKEKRKKHAEELEHWHHHPESKLYPDSPLDRFIY